MFSLFLFSSSILFHSYKENESKIFLLVGPSGVGKDTLKNGSKQVLKNVSFPQRTITREKSKEEDNEFVTIEEFKNLEKDNKFGLSWKAYDLYYGIRDEHIKEAIKKKENIILNVSRDVIEQAQSKYSNVYVLEIASSPNIIRERLIKRNRESLDQIEERIKRNQYQMDLVKKISKNLIILYNDSTIQEGIDNFIKIVS